MCAITNINNGYFYVLHHIFIFHHFDFTSLSNYQLQNGHPTNLNSNKYHKCQYLPLNPNKININCNVCNYKH